MDIYAFISKDKDQPILFIRFGFSMRYAKMIAIPFAISIHAICLSVYLSICLSVYLSICLSVYQKHNYLALYCQLIDSLCYLFPVIFLFKKSAIFFGQSIFSKNTTGTSTFFRFCLSSHTLKRRSDMKPKSRAS